MEPIRTKTLSYFFLLSTHSSDGVTSLSGSRCIEFFFFKDDLNQLEKRFM